MTCQVVLQTYFSYTCMYISRVWHSCYMYMYDIMGGQSAEGTDVKTTGIFSI